MCLPSKLKLTIHCREPLQRSGKDFTIMKVLPSGVYHYKFIVDGERKCSPEVPWVRDEMGNECNLLDLLVRSFFCS